MIAWLATSTLILGIALAAARLPRLTARTRHAILLCGLVSFALPPMAITALLRLAGLTAVVPVPATLRVFTAAAATPANAAHPSPNWFFLGWAAIAALLLVRWFVAAVRLHTSALRFAVPASSRERRLLDAARAAIGVRTVIDLLRTNVTEAPAVLRVVRPVIVLPATACDDLSDDELLSLLCHETAHVARRDNLTGVFEAMAGALLWFHPLVWLALHELHVRREEACDEAAAEATSSEVYLSALTRICQAAAAPRLAGVSCMANAKIKERIGHLMTYTRTKSLSHRIVLATAVVALFTILATSALATEQPAAARPFTFKFHITPNGSQFVLDATVTQNDSGAVVAKPRLTAPFGVPAQIRSSDDHGHAVEIDVTTGKDGSGKIEFAILRGGEELQRQTFAFTKYTGEPISMNLKDADLSDVIHTFGSMTNMAVVIDDGVTAKVTIDVTDMPWDEALDQIARQTGTTITVENKTLHVSK